MKVVISDDVVLVLKEIPTPNERQLKFKDKSCSRCGRSFKPKVGTQPTCGACYYEVKCTACGKWFAPKPVKATKAEQVVGKNKYCTKYCGDTYKVKVINSTRMVDGRNRWECNTEKARAKIKELAKNPEWRAKHPKHPVAFDRNEFYSKELSLISFECADKSVTPEDVDKYKGVPIVFSKEVYTKDGEFVCCLDVGESKDGKEEIAFGLRAWAWALKNIEMTVEEIKQKRLKSVYTRLKYQKMVKEVQKDPNYVLVLKVVAEGVEDTETRRAIEAQYAHDKKALFWSPSPGQSIYVD